MYTDRSHLLFFRNAKTNVASGNLLTDMSDHFTNFLILHSNTQYKGNERPMVSWDEELSNKNVNDSMEVFS